MNSCYCVHTWHIDDAHMRQRILRTFWFVFLLLFAFYLTENLVLLDFTLFLSFAVCGFGWYKYNILQALHLRSFIATLTWFIHFFFGPYFPFYTYIYFFLPVFFWVILFAFLSYCCVCAPNAWLLCLWICDRQCALSPEISETDWKCMSCEPSMSP